MQKQAIEYTFLWVFATKTFTTTEATENQVCQNNLGRGPRRGAVARVRRKVPISYNGAPQIRPQKYPFRELILEPR